MTEVLARKTFKIFEFRIIRGADSLWLKLSYIGRTELQQFWQAEENAEIESAENLIELLKSRLVKMSVDEAVLFFPKGWKYWGGGIPKPLIKFVAESLTQNSEKATV